jgi:hypothetical protein
MGFDDEAIGYERGNPFERGKRVAQMVEDGGEQHDIERPDALCGQLVQVELGDLDRGCQMLAHQLERSPLAPRLARPCEMIGRQHAIRAAPHCLERIVTVPAADIEEAATTDQIIGEIDLRLRLLVAQFTPALADYSTAEVDLMVPSEPIDLPLKLGVECRQGRALQCIRRHQYPLVECHGHQTPGVG